MKIEFLAQPFGKSATLYSILSEWLSDPKITRLEIAVAWAKRSGLRFIREQIEDFTARGGELHLIIGIDAGGASRQGIELAYSLATTCAIFHHPSSRTFHPKAYIATGTNCAQAIIGSNNLTQGGLFENFETSIRLFLDPSNETDARHLAEIQRLFECYRTAGNCYVELDETLLCELLNSPLYDIEDEDQSSAVTRTGNITTEDRESNRVIFGPGTAVLSKAPQSSRLVGAGENVTRKSRLVENSSPPRSDRAGLTTVQARWYKKLSAADAQRPEGANTNPTGHLTLVKAQHPIESASWFRDSFFGSQDWVALGTGKERASVKFRVTIHGKDHGSHSLDVTHTPAFESGQGNRTTVLHWGPQVGELLKDKNMKGDYVSLERTSNLRYRLVIAPDPSGSFLRG